MKCPYCGKEDTRVIDSRPADQDTSIRRRRICDACGKRFTTYEKIETIPLVVIKKDNNREPYNRDKIRQGLVAACHKRPVSAAQRRSGAATRRTPPPVPRRRPWGGGRSARKTDRSRCRTSR